MKRLPAAFVCLLFLNLQLLHAQSFAINTTGLTADAAAMLDVSSSNKGLLIPRIALSSTNIAAPVTAPVASLLLYNTASAGSGNTAVSPGFYFWDGGQWQRLQYGSSSGWSLTGNAGTSNSNFIGTTDNQDIFFRRSNVNAGFISTLNTSLGYASLNTNTSGDFNVAIGTSVLTYNTSGAFNQAIGYAALATNTSGTANTGMGYLALYSNTDGGYNVGLGFASLYKNMSGGYNIAIGNEALYNNLNATGNTGIGQQAMYSNTGGAYNTALGAYSQGMNTTGNNNVSLGTFSAYLGNSGNGNVSVGYQALYTNASGGNNVAIGNGAGYNTGGDNNIVIGYNADVPLNSGSNQVRIGNTAITYAGVQVAWTVTSDRRWKTDIRDAELGLGFIRQLHPVSYIRKNDPSQKREYGFVAQELDSLLQQRCPDNGIINKDSKGYLGVRYNDLLAPMVKAIQEQQEMIEKLKAEVEGLRRK